MSHEIHLTRGPGFGAPGEQPLTPADWEALGSAHPELVLTRPGSKFGRIGGRPVVFNAGIISVTSPDEASFAVLRTIAGSSRARIFGEDGLEYGLGTLEDVRCKIDEAFADLDATTLGSKRSQQLADVSDGGGCTSADQLRGAVGDCCQLEGASAEAALAYLCSRAVEAGGDPPATSTVVAAHLVHHAPARLQAFRSEPTDGWVAEVEALAKLLVAKPGAYVIRKCHQCGTKNRRPLFAPEDQQPKCGRCKGGMDAVR